MGKGLSLIYREEEKKGSRGKRRRVDPADVYLFLKKKGEGSGLLMTGKKGETSGGGVRRSRAKLPYHVT